MMKETENILHINLDFLPLKSYTNIVEGNALEIDWNEVLPNTRCNYIMGNPPFIGARLMEQGSKQKKEIEKIFGEIQDVQDLDYVSGWYKKAGIYIDGTLIEVGFVSTNSICQGAQVPILWNVLLNELNLKINFAYQTFKWNSESTKKAAVFCVIIGFSKIDKKNKKIFISNLGKDKDKFILAEYINPYLLPSKTSFVVAQKEALCDVPKMNFGNQPRDGGYFVLSKEEKDELIKREPFIDKWIHPYIGAVEFINNKERYCIWTKNATPTEIKNSKILYERIQKVKEFRENSKAKTTNGYAKVPHSFAQVTQPDNVDYLIIPRVSSERRRYVPIGFATSDIISSDAVQIVPNADIYMFGILTSNVHMAWMRTVAGRLKNDYRYSKELVYNTFPWPIPTITQKQKIEKSAQAILDARKLYSQSSLADLYDETLMPKELRKAHQENDKAVMEAYGFNWRDMTESECVTELMKIYQKLISK